MDLLDGAMVHDQAFWLICAVFYLADNARLHAGRELLLTETLGGRWTPALPLNRVRLAGRAVTLLQPLLPFSAAVRIDWLADGASSAARLRGARRLLRLRQRRLAPYRVLGNVLFAALFIAAPLATHRAGLGLALLLVLPVHLAALAALAVLLAAERRAWRMVWPRVTGLVFECAVCPGYFANICRKLSRGLPALPMDPMVLAADQGGAEEAARITGRLELLLEDLAENDELRAEDAKTVAAYRDRLTAAGAHV